LLDAPILERIPRLPELSAALPDPAPHRTRQLRDAAAEFGNGRYPNRFGRESAALSDLVRGAGPEIESVTIDTGRRSAETDAGIESLQRRDGRAMRVDRGDRSAREVCVTLKEINGFGEELCERRRACQIGTGEPFRGAPTAHPAGVSGMRRGRSANRALAGSDVDIAGYIRANRLPYNGLREAGLSGAGGGSVRTRRAFAAAAGLATAPALPSPRDVVKWSAQ
jgi:3'-phosphoadenosine 5'-phosphosulfate sulfotransferase (PAPS reductase)/FAD synthetase